MKRLGDAALTVMTAAAITCPLWLTFGSPLSADQHAPPRQAEPAALPAFDMNPPRLAKVVLVHDGDSCTFSFVTVQAPGVKQATEIKTRLFGYDAPELTTNQHGVADKVNGPKARDALIALLGSGKVWVRYTGEFSFDRSVGEVWVIGADGIPVAVAEKMKAMGYDRTPKAK